MATYRFKAVGFFAGVSGVVYHVSKHKSERYGNQLKFFNPDDLVFISAFHEYHTAKGPDHLGGFINNQNPLLNIEYEPKTGKRFFKKYCETCVDVKNLPNQPFLAKLGLTNKSILYRVSRKRGTFRPKISRSRTKFS